MENELLKAAELVEEWYEWGEPFKEYDDAMRLILNHAKKARPQPPLKPDAAEALGALALIQQYAKETYEHWHSDADHKVGKRLNALSGDWPMYSPQITEAFRAIRAFLQNAVTIPRADIESLRKNPDEMSAPDFQSKGRYTYALGWNDCIDHLAAQGYLTALQNAGPKSITNEEYRDLCQKVFDWAQDCKGLPLQSDIDGLLDIVKQAYALQNAGATLNVQEQIDLFANFQALFGYPNLGRRDEVILGHFIHHLEHMGFIKVDNEKPSAPTPNAEG